MKTPCRLLIVCLAVSGATLVNCATESGKQEMPAMKKPPTYTLDLDDPFAFLKEHLPHALDEAPGDSVASDGLDGNSIVCIRGGDESVEMAVELVTGNEMPGENRYYIRLSGVPATLDDTYSLALRLCDLAQIRSDRIAAWYKENKHGGSPTNADFQTGVRAHNRHEVEVRSSLQVEGETPWRVLYTIYFPNPEGMARDE